MDYLSLCNLHPSSIELQGAYMLFNIVSVSAWIRCCVEMYLLISTKSDEISIFYNAVLQELILYTFM